MHPENGGRFVARLLAHDAERGRFAVELATATALWSSEVEVAASDGTLRWQPWTGPGEPPEWLRHYAHAALRTSWRQHAQQGWPRRLTRWRAEPQSGGGED
jgi:hypothetical protein